MTTGSTVRDTTMVMLMARDRVLKISSLPRMYLA